MKSEAPSRPVEILLVEDNPGDVDLVKIGFKELAIPSHVRVARDGVEALAMLRLQGNDSGQMLPDLILLDLNLPRKHGHEVLAEIKRIPELRGIPVVVLTSSHSDDDVVRSHKLHADGYLTKPTDIAEIRSTIRMIGECWLAPEKLSTAAC